MADAAPPDAVLPHTILADVVLATPVPATPVLATPVPATPVLATLVPATPVLATPVPATPVLAPPVVSEPLPTFDFSAGLLDGLPTHDALSALTLGGAMSANSLVDLPALTAEDELLLEGAAANCVIDNSLLSSTPPVCGTTHTLVATSLAGSGGGSGSGGSDGFGSLVDLMLTITNGDASSLSNIIAYLNACLVGSTGGRADLDSRPTPLVESGGSGYTPAMWSLPSGITVAPSDTNVTPSAITASNSSSLLRSRQ